ncbi:MAG: alcohol dehydrogenase catalytic domain-containing protein [Phycisphaerales bacterium]|nr:alcohol dehydrogenase catalytic domain-containing protein [Planctomycetota bacterium]
MRRVAIQGSAWALVDGPEAAAAPDEALVRVTRAALVPRELARCRAAGGRFIPGREFVGVVVQGPAHWVNKRIVSGAAVTCAECDLCRAGLSTHCRARKELGVGRDGALAERIVLPIGALTEIPRTLEDERAIFAPVLARVLHAAQFVRVEGKPFVTVVGDGAMGLLAAQVMTQRNASVRVLGREPARFGLSEKWGVKHRHIDEVGRRGDQDLVFVCSDAPGDLEAALRLARPRATVLLLSDAAPATETSTVLELLHNSEISLIGCRGERLAEAVRLLGADLVDVRSLLTSRHKPLRLGDAIAAAERPESVRVVLEFADEGQKKAGPNPNNAACSGLSSPRC